MDEKQILIEEWKETRESLRYFGNKRFTQLTIFIAANGFMLDAFFKQPNKFFLQIAGVVIGLLFFAMERSSVQDWAAVADRGKKIEGKVGHLELMTHHRPINKVLSATYFVYWGFILLWLNVATLANPPAPKAATDTAASAPNETAQPSAPAPKPIWNSPSFNWEDSSHAYKLSLRATNSPPTLLPPADITAGKAVKIEKPAP